MLFGDRGDRAGFVSFFVGVFRFLERDGDRCFEESVDGLCLSEF